MIKTEDDVKQLGTILTVWAHPDDESYLAAGLLAAAVQNGQTVICATATRGEKGVQDETRWPIDNLAEIRSKELEDGLEILGITKHYWLDFEDGCCADVDDDAAVAKLSKLIEQYQPDTILTFGPDGLTGHPDHQSVSRWCSVATEQAKSKPTIFCAVYTPDLFKSHLREIDDKMDFFFNIKEPPLRAEKDCDICFNLSPELCRKKLEALLKMPSQTEQLFTSFDYDFLQEALGTETFVQAQ